MDNKSIVSIAKKKSTIFNAVKEAVDLLGGMDKFVKKGDKVILKPNLAYPYPPPATTDPRVVNAVIKLCFEAGAASVGVGDSSSYSCKNIIGTGKWDNKGLMDAWGMQQAVEGTDADIRDFDFEPWTKVEIPKSVVLKKTEIASAMLECDVVINIPALKMHFETTVTLGVKNYHGILPDHYKIQFHKDDINQKLIDIHKAVKTDLTIMDGLVGMEGTGPRTGQPVEMNVILASRDVIALDSVACELMELPADEVETNRLGQEQGIGNMDMDKISVVGESIDACKKKFKLPDIRLGGLHPGVTIIKGGPCVHCYGRARMLLDNLDNLGIKNYGGVSTLIVGIKPRIPDLDEIDGDVIIVGDCAIESADNLRYGLGKRAYCMTGCPPIPSLHRVVEQIQEKVKKKGE